MSVLLRACDPIDHRTFGSCENCEELSPADIASILEDGAEDAAEARADYFDTASDGWTE